MPTVPILRNSYVAGNSATLNTSQNTSFNNVLHEWCPAGALLVTSLLPWAFLIWLCNCSGTHCEPPLFTAYLRIPQILASFPICCPKEKWSWTPDCCNATGPAIMCCNEEKSEMGRKGEVTWKQEAVSKGTKASAVHWERWGTYCHLSLQVMAGSCSQYLIRWESELFLFPDLMCKLHSAPFSSLHWPMGKAPREHSYIAEGTGRTGCPPVQIKSCFLLCPVLCAIWGGLNQPRDTLGSQTRVLSPVPARHIYLQVHYLIRSSALEEVTTVTEDCSGQTEVKLPKLSIWLHSIPHQTQLLRQAASAQPRLFFLWSPPSNAGPVFCCLSSRLSANITHWETFHSQLEMQPTPLTSLLVQPGPRRAHPYYSASCVLCLSQVHKRSEKAPSVTSRPFAKWSMSHSSIDTAFTCKSLPLRSKYSASPEGLFKIWELV